MKEYKVGDTIYVKDTVADIDTDDNDMTYRGSRCGWLYKSNVVDELPTAEPVKPVLPKDVAEELVLAKESGDTFYNYITDHVAHPKTYLFMFKYFDNNTRVVALFDAWFNGYTVEKPKLYNLVLGKNMWGWPLALYKPTGNDNNLIAYPDAAPKYLRDSVYQFTQEEIDKYNKNFWINNIDLNDYKELVADDSED